MSKLNCAALIAAACLMLVSLTPFAQEPVSADSSAVNSSSAASSVVPSALTALETDSKRLSLAQQITTIEQFFQKKLVGTQALKKVMPEAWLAEGFSPKRARQEAEEALTQLLAKQAEQPSSAPHTDQAKQEILLWQLKLQWLNYSSLQRKQLLAEAEAKALALRTQVQAEADINQAANVVREVDKNKQAISQAMELSRSARETQLLEAQLALENATGEFGEWRLALAATKKIFAADIDLWRQQSSQLAAYASASSESASQRYRLRNDTRLLLRNLLHASNDRLWSRTQFFKHYQGVELAWQPVRDLAALRIENDDSEQAQKIIFDLQEKYFLLNARIKELNRERAQLLKEILRWNQQQRVELLDLRGAITAQYIEENAFQLGNPEPLWLELKTLAARLSFAFWSIEFGWWQDASGGVLVASNLAHLFNILLLLALTVLVLVKKAPILLALRKRLNASSFSGVSRRLLFIGFNLFKYFYVFLVLVIMVKLVIDFVASLGFTPILGLLPLYDHLVLFFMMWSALNYVVPLLSQRGTGKLSQKTMAIESALTLLPKILLYYWLIAGLVRLSLGQLLNVNLLELYIVALVKIGCLVFIYLGVKHNIAQWRVIGAPVDSDARLSKFIVDAQGRWWEPLVLLVSGGLGVYRLLWNALSARLSELDMTRSLQATLSRAILERQKPRLLVQESLAEIPQEYRDRFDYNQTVGADAYVPRAEQDQQLLDILAEWKSTKIGARVIVTGDRGVGKSALINHFLQGPEVGDFYCLKLHPSMASVARLQTYLDSFFGAPDLAGLIEKIDSLPPCVIVAENIENLLLRKIGGFEAIALMIDIVLHTSARHLWIVSCNSYSWTIAKQGVRGIDCFTDAIEMEGMSEEEITHLVMGRHQLAQAPEADFTQLQFSAKNKKYINTAEGNRKAQQLYFRILWSYTRGNPRHALYHWKNSLLWSEASLVVKLFNVPQQKILERLQDGSLMLLAALIEHNGLTLSGLGEIMNTTESIALRRIEEISSYSMVFSVGEDADESWHVDSFWFKAIENYLVKRQFLFHGGRL